MSSWRLIPFGKYDPYLNMAIDEAILLARAEGLIPSILRFYGWWPIALSIGYFQKLEEIDLKLCRREGIAYVRRPTGGGAVLHQGDLTYSLSAQISDLPDFKDILDSYRLISQGIIEGLRPLGIEAQVFSRGEKRRGEGSLCFASPSRYDIVVRGRKLAGSAQRRRNKVLLHQGSLLMDSDQGGIFPLLLNSLLRLTILTRISSSSAP